MVTMIIYSNDTIPFTQPTTYVLIHCDHNGCANDDNGVLIIHNEITVLTFCIATELVSTFDFDF